MSQNIDALHLIMSAILSTSPWLRDPYVVSIPWRQDIAEGVLSRAAANGFANDKVSLKLGFLPADGIITPHPPIQRGLRLVADAIRKAGHKAGETSYLTPSCSAHCLGSWSTGNRLLMARRPKSM